MSDDPVLDWHCSTSEAVAMQAEIQSLVLEMNAARLRSQLDLAAQAEALIINRKIQDKGWIVRPKDEYAGGRGYYQITFLKNFPVGSEVMAELISDLRVSRHPNPEDAPGEAESATGHKL